MGCLIYDPKSCKAVAIISSKATLRERVAQVESPVTKNIKVFFITLDEDGDLVIKKPTKKSRAITKAIRSK
jgi:type II restriction enzyme